jgi:hypothetical protein
MYQRTTGPARRPPRSPPSKREPTEKLHIVYANTDIGAASSQARNNSSRHALTRAACRPPARVGMGVEQPADEARMVPQESNRNPCGAAQDRDVQRPLPAHLVGQVGPIRGTDIAGLRNPATDQQSVQPTILPPAWDCGRRPARPAPAHGRTDFGQPRPPQRRGVKHSQKSLGEYKVVPWPGAGRGAAPGRRHSPSASLGPHSAGSGAIKTPEDPYPLGRTINRARYRT